jgi:hypothetical protein
MINIPADIDVIARMSYERGQDPVEFAETCIMQNHLDVYLTIVSSRAEDPATFPGYALELSPQATARRIIGDLLDAGWLSPTLATETTGAHAQVSYAVGVSPIGYAEELIAGLFETHIRIVREITGCGLGSLCDITGEMSIASLSRELLVQLRAAGWEVPGGIEIPDRPDAPEVDR